MQAFLSFMKEPWSPCITTCSAALITFVVLRMVCWIRRPYLLKQPVANTFTIVTGASSGIGLAATNHLLKRKFNVVSVARSDAELVKLESQYPGQLTIMKQDLTQASGIQALKEFTDQNAIQCCFHSAGVCQVIPELLENIEAKEVDAVISLNVMSTTKVAQIFAEKFRKQKFGTLIMMGSAMQTLGAPYLSVYSASKAYVRSLGEILQAEMRKLRDVKIRVAAPFWVATPMTMTKRTSLLFCDANQYVQKLFNDRGSKLVLEVHWPHRVLACLLSHSGCFRWSIQEKQMITSRGKIINKLKRESKI